MRIVRTAPMLLSLALVLCAGSAALFSSEPAKSGDHKPPGCLTQPPDEWPPSQNLAARYEPLFDLEAGKANGTVLIRFNPCGSSDPYIFPYPGVRVSLYLEDMEIARTYTDDHGVFELEVPPLPRFDIGIFQPFDHAVFFRGVMARPERSLKFGDIITFQRFHPTLLRIAFKDVLSKDKGQKILSDNCLIEEFWENENTVIAGIDDDSHMYDALKRLMNVENVEMAEPAFFFDCEP